MLRPFKAIIIKYYTPEKALYVTDEKCSENVEKKKNKNKADITVLGRIKMRLFESVTVSTVLAWQTDLTHSLVVNFY